MKAFLTLIIISLLAFPFTTYPQAGALDETYGDEGIAIFGPSPLHEIAHDLVILEDTSTIICGSAYFSGSFDGFLMRILPDGSQDMSFGDNGIVQIEFGTETYPYSMSLQADGKLVLAGLTYPTSSNSELFIARYMPDGTPDLTFNSTGYYIGSYSSEDEIVNTMVIQPDGKYLFAGRTHNGDFSQLLFGRINPNGTLDNSFGTNGYTEINASMQDEAINSIKLMDDGTIIGVGYGFQGDPMWGEQVFMAKLNPNGTPVSGFGTNGVLIPSVFNDISLAFDLVVDNDSIYVTGYMYNASNQWQLFLAKLNPAGIPYSGFGTNGISFLFINPLNVGYEILQTSDKKLYVCGTTGLGGTGNREFLLARFLPDGELDPDFDSEGYVVTPIRPDWDEANALVMQPDGKIVLAGMTSGFSTTGNNDIAMTRYLNDFLPSGLYSNFNANITTACEGSQVQYTDLSFSTDSIILTWNWAFEGGSPATSSAQNPLVTYSNDGVYDVRLIVYDGIFIDTLLRENYITVESVPGQPEAPTGPASLCGGYEGSYSTIPVMYADDYDWEVTPAGAGTITGNGTAATFLASTTWTGTCGIKTRAVSQCGNGTWSNVTSCLVSHNPVQFDLTGEGGYCEDSEGSELLLSGSETGVDYELYLDNELTGIVLPGTGSPLNFGYFTEPGIYSALGYTDNCSAFMVGQIYVHEMPAPGQASMPAGSETGCDGQSSTYTTALINNADVYIWTLAPEEAGMLTPVFDTAHIAWNPGFTGNASLSVHAENLCGDGPESQPLEISISLSPTPEVSGLEIACSDYEENYETAYHEGSFYTWEVTGGVIADGAGTNQVVVLWGAPGAGTLSVMEESAQGCIAGSEIFDVTIEICEYIGENSAGKIRIYPNPAKDFLNVEIGTGNEILNGEMTIISAYGSTVYDRRFSSQADLEMINVSGFAPGIYTVRYKNPGGDTLSAKVMITK